jgi:hypothetical protein
MMISKRRKLERNLPKSFTNLCDFIAFFLQMGGDSFWNLKKKKGSLEHVAQDFKKKKRKESKMANFHQKKKKKTDSFS